MIQQFKYKWHRCSDSACRPKVNKTRKQMLGFIFYFVIISLCFKHQYTCKFCISFLNLPHIEDLLGESLIDDLLGESLMDDLLGESLIDNLLGDWGGDWNGDGWGDFGRLSWGNVDWLGILELLPNGLTLHVRTFSLAFCTYPWEKLAPFWKEQYI